MDQRTLIFFTPPDLSDEAAAGCLDLLYEMTLAFEKHYADQLRRHYGSDASSQPDLFDEEDEPLPF